MKGGIVGLARHRLIWATAKYWWLFADAATSRQDILLRRGLRWSEPKREDVWGHPFDAVKMPRGNVLLTYGYRREPYGIRARLLHPECDNISASEEFVLRDDGSSTDLGYPQSTLLSDGTALVTYYYQTKMYPTGFIAGAIVSED